MVEVSRIARENGSSSFLIGSKFTNVVLRNLFWVKKYSTWNCTQFTTDSNLCLSVFRYSTAHCQLSVNI